MAKNTLVRIAAKEAGIEGLDELLAGPTAVTFVKGDFIEAAKTLRDFAKTNKALIIKGGFADGTVYDAEGAKKLADLKSRPQLLAEFAGDIKATMSKAAYLFNALPTKAVRTIDALREKQDSDHKRKIIVLGDGHLFNQTVAKNERKPLWLSTPTMSCSKLSVR